VSAYQASSYGAEYNDGVTDTRAAAKDADGELSNMGYSSDYYWNADADADDAYNRIASDHVFYFFGHGAPGKILFQGDFGGPSTPITADHPDLLRISDLTYYSMHDIALAVYLSCNSANSDPLNGNLLDVSQSKGVDCCIGFSNTVKQGQGTVWSDRLWHYLDEQYTFKGAVDWAIVDVRLQYWLDAGGTDSYDIRGDDDIVIDPARAGS
jgi:hypothetical protein